MSSRLGVGVGAVLLVAVALTGCQGDPSVMPIAPIGSVSPTPALSEPVTLADAVRCPVTPPKARGPRGVSPNQFFGWGASHGNKHLWVGGLWPDGVLDVGPEFVEKDGSIRMKFGWWRFVSGDLSISGRRLDASAPPLRSDVPDGYGDEGFQATDVYFPTEGCWEVVGEVGTETMTFVTFVIKHG